MLIENTLFGTVDKVNDAVTLLQANEPPDGYYVAFSGGKDSVVILDLVKRAGVKFEAHYNYMTVEPPELLEFIVTEYPEVVFEYPKTTMYDLIIYNHIPPMRTARYCCRALKVDGGAGRVKVTGIRREESRYRSSRKEIEDGGKLINPIVSWKVGDIWEYIKKFKVPYCKLYDEGRQRIGCIFCPNASKEQLQDDLKRYPQFRNYFIAALDKVIDIQETAGKVSKHKTGAEWFDAWICRDNKKNKPQNSASLF